MAMASRKRGLHYRPRSAKSILGMYLTSSHYLVCFSHGCVSYHYFLSSGMIHIRGFSWVSRLAVYVVHVPLFTVDLHCLVSVGDMSMGKGLGVGRKPAKGCLSTTKLQIRYDCAMTIT